MIVSIVGARPNFIKLAPITREAQQRGLKHAIINTNQHADADMNHAFFEALGLPEPAYSCAVTGGAMPDRFAHMLRDITKGLQMLKPDWVLVYGDVLTTAAGALAARFYGAKLAHYGSGVRSGDMDMPEEANRRIVDAITDLHLANHESGVANLKREGVDAGKIVEVGNLLVDALKTFEPSFTDVAKPSAPYALVTLHRPETVDDSTRLRSAIGAIINACGGLDIVFPVHPRTRAQLDVAKIDLHSLPSVSGLHVSGPKSYFNLMGLLRGASLVITDSAGLREEAYVMKRPCVTIREGTEWPTTLEFHQNLVSGYDPGRIHDIISKLRYSEFPEDPLPPTWDGFAAHRILDAIAEASAKSL